MFGLFKKKEKLFDQQANKEKPSILRANIEGNTQSDLRKQKNQDLQKSIEDKEKELATSQSATKTAKEEAQAAQKSLAEIKAKLEAKEKELATSQSATKTAKEEAQAAQKSLAEIKAKLEAKEKELGISKIDFEKKSREIDQKRDEFELSDLKYDHILLQLLQLQEDMAEGHVAQEELVMISEAYKKRFERLTKRIPEYVDYSEVIITDADSVPDRPTVFWRVKNLTTYDIENQELNFALSLFDGHPGIGLMVDGKPQIFAPKLLGIDSKQADIFINLGTNQYRLILSAIEIFKHLESIEWEIIQQPPGFDLAFWRPFIKALISQFQLLPATLRYDEVKLKRELINPDYEHIWIEFIGLSVNNKYWNKFEIRLGASHIQNDGFSQHPKFEIPLIDGNLKPFDSWYEESRDDSGAKLEIRFSLEKNIFDVAVWTRLSSDDRLLLLRLFYAMPNALRYLSSRNIILSRPFSTWINFSSKAVKVIEVVINKQKELEQKPKAQSSKTIDAQINKDSLELNHKNDKYAPVVQRSQLKDAGNIINISSDMVNKQKSTVIKKRKINR
jgi:hypothetical protein